MLSHFGTNFQRNNFPINFRNSLNNIEKKVFILKDSLSVLDDLNPEVTNKNKEKIFEEVTGLFGDRVGRARMSSNGQDLKRAYTARGTCIATGEYIPNLALSRISRLMILSVKSNSVNLKRLKNVQDNKEMLSFNMKKYIEWIIKKEKEIRNYAKQKILYLQEKQSDFLHGRLNENINAMYIAYDIFLKFLQENKIINKEEYNKLSNECYSILTDISNKQQNEIEKTNPIEMFYGAIEELLNTGKICLLNYKTGEPVNEKGTGTFAGYLDNEKNRYYFFKETIYKEIYKFYSANDEKFPLPALSLWRYLQEEGVLYMTDESRKTVLRTDVTTGKKVRVVDVEIRNANINIGDEKSKNI